MVMQRIKVGLALGSGGARGLAHIGVIKALEEHDIPIDMIVGSSAGALIGGVYLALGSIAELENFVHSLTYKDLAWMFLDIGSPSGLIRGNKIEQYLERVCSGLTIESLSRPFAAVATDLATGKAMPLRSGPLSRAIRASSSVPALIDAVELGGQRLVDGGTSFPVPVPIVRDLGADFVIAVNLDVYPFIQTGTASRPPTVSDMGRTAIELLRFNLANMLCRDANCTIVPDVARVSSLNLMKFIRGEEIIQKGYDAAMEIMPILKRDISRT